jgi:molybdate transport system ATP-binding protein
MLTVRLRFPLDRFDLDVDFVARQRVTGVFGASGAGKTSLLKAVAGLKRRADGVVRLGEETWLDSAAGIYLPPERRDVGYVPQDGLLFPHRDVRRNLLAGAERARRRGGDPEATLAGVCDLLELTPLLDREPATLSGGERQRVALGRALCSGPRLLLLDEPLASLDLPLRRRILPLLARVRDELTVPMLFVSHDPVEMQALCDEVVVLAAGRVVAAGPPHRVLTDPAVFALADEAGYENVLPGVLLETDGDTARVRLEAGGTGADADADAGAPVLVTPRSTGRPGDRLLVSLPAREILIATRRPEGLSARNVLPARVTALRPAGAFHLLTASLHPALPEVVSEISAATCERLGLAPGGEVFLIVKAAGLRLYEEKRPADRGAARPAGDARGLSSS